MVVTGRRGGGDVADDAVHLALDVEWTSIYLSIHVWPWAGGWRGALDLPSRSAESMLPTMFMYISQANEGRVVCKNTSYTT